MCVSDTAVMTVRYLGRVGAESCRGPMLMSMYPPAFVVGVALLVAPRLATCACYAAVASVPLHVPCDVFLTEQVLWQPDNSNDTTSGDQHKSHTPHIHRPQPPAFPLNSLCVHRPAAATAVRRRPRPSRRCRFGWPRGGSSATMRWMRTGRRKRSFTRDGSSSR
jgi:hypothetical protein